MAINSLPASTSLVDEINALAPKRSKASDGTIGNQAHAESVSDHNPDESGNTGGVEDSDSIDEVHARDVDSNGPWPAGWSMERIVQIILTRCRTGAEKRLRYVIFNRRIWSASTGWVQRTYTGPSPHTEHGHFSFRYGSGSGTSNPENITTPWGILAAYEQENDVSQADVIAALKSAEGKALIEGYVDSALRGWEEEDPNSTATPRGKLRIGGLLRMSEQRAGNRQAQLLAAVTGVDVDESAVAAAVLTGLTPELIAAAIPADLARQVAQELADRLAA